MTILKIHLIFNFFFSHKNGDIKYLGGHVNCLHVQCFCHKTSNDSSGSSIHGFKHVHDSHGKLVAGIHPGIYSRRCCAQ